jgi:hypothetical protein
MPLVLADRVNETSQTTGTGSLTLDGAVNNYQSFAVIGNGNTTYYTIAHQTANEWEVGIGTYTASGTLLSRDTVLASSNSGSPVNLSVGTKSVFVVYPAGKSVNQDASGNVTIAGNLTAGVVGASNGILVNSGVTGTSYTIGTNYNGFTVGPHTVGSGATVTVAAGQRWVII